jgi:hypothetical protein
MENIRSQFSDETMILEVGTIFALSLSLSFHPSITDSEKFPKGILIDSAQKENRTEGSTHG